MRTLVTMIATLTMALGAIGLAVASPGRERLASPTLASASGALHIANSRAGQAVLTAAGMRPGTGVSGEVQIGNDGDLAGRFGVSVIAVDDDPGPYGGPLSERLQLVVFDVTDTPPITVYSGSADDLQDIDLGTFAAGEERTYRLAVTLPDGGVPGSNTTGDNRFQGSGVSLGLEWRAGTVPLPTPTPKPKPTPAPTPKPTPTATPTPAPLDVATAMGLPPATTCVKGKRMKFKLRGPESSKVVSATVAVNGKVKKRLKGAKVRKPVFLRKLRKTTKLKVTVRASNGRTYVGLRTYRACAKR